MKLSCKNLCDLDDNPEVVWRKNDQYIFSKQTSQLVLLNIRMEDEGNYSCVLKDHDSHPSQPVALNVMCK